MSDSGTTRGLLAAVLNDLLAGDETLSPAARAAIEQLRAWQALRG